MIWEENLAHLLALGLLGPQPGVERPWAAMNINSHSQGAMGLQKQLRKEAADEEEALSFHYTWTLPCHRSDWASLPFRTHLACLLWSAANANLEKCIKKP